MFRKFVEGFKEQMALNRLEEQRVYAHILDEMESQEILKGLWAKALQLTDFDENRAKAKYMELRYQSILDDQFLLRKIIRNVVGSRVEDIKGEASIVSSSDEHKENMFQTADLAISREDIASEISDKPFINQLVDSIGGSCLSILNKETNFTLKQFMEDSNIGSFGPMYAKEKVLNKFFTDWFYQTDYTHRDYDREFERFLSVVSLIIVRHLNEIK